MFVCVGGDEQIASMGCKPSRQIYSPESKEDISSPPRAAFRAENSESVTPVTAYSNPTCNESELEPHTREVAHDILCVCCFEFFCL